jgi:hypothetical protein
MSGVEFGYRVISWYVLTRLENLRYNMHDFAGKRVTLKTVEEAIELCIDRELVFANWCVMA